MTQSKKPPNRLTGIPFGCSVMGLIGLMGSQGYCEELQIGVSQSIPPYVIQENDSGLELELLFQALAVKGHSAKIHYLPLARTFHELSEGKLDGVINIKQGMLEKVFYTDIALSFQNCAISLQQNHLDIKGISDLAAKKVVAFQRASIVLGEEFSQMAKANSGYQEQAKQIQQVYMLFKHRVDVVVMDRNIFKYYAKQAFIEGKLTESEVKQVAICHQLFPPTDYRFAFSNEKIRDDFNFGLKQITQDGTLSALQEKYQHLLRLQKDTEVTSILLDSPIKPQ
ncbi:transporter substrate-binding domain-containing protein [Shewanella sp. A25]|nr:transporter substrate-binding domain-containing protein [Shewanella shenzhenensis]